MFMASEICEVAAASISATRDATSELLISKWGARGKLADTRLVVELVDPRSLAMLWKFVRFLADLLGVRCILRSWCFLLLFFWGVMLKSRRREVLWIGAGLGRVATIASMNPFHSASLYLSISSVSLSNWLRGRFAVISHPNCRIIDRYKQSRCF